MDKTRLDHLAQLYSTSCTKTAITNSELKLLWSNSPHDFEGISFECFSKNNIDVIEKGSFPTEKEVFIFVKLGSFEGTARVVPIIEDEALVGYVIMLEDVFGIFTAERFSPVSNARQNHLAQIRTAVSEIVANSTVLRDMLENSELSDNDDVYQLFARIDRGCYKALAAGSNFSELISYSLGEHNKCTFNASDYLTDLLSLCVSSFRSTNIELEYNVEPEIYLDCDSDRLTAVVLNLIVNSATYNISEKRKIHVDFKSVDSEARLTISDNGLGISPQRLEKAFVPFALNEQFSDRNGLGLPLLKLFADSFGGAVNIRSTENEGTDVYLRLPKASPNTTKLNSPARRYLSDRFSQFNIYLSKIISFG